MASETEIERLVIKLLGDASGYLKMLQEAKEKTEAAEKSISGRMKKIGASMKQVGRSLSLHVTAPIVGIGALATREFAKFDDAMTRSTAIMSTTSEQTQRMRDLAISLSGQSVQGPEELAESYFFLASAGFDAEASMANLPTVMKFATAGAFDMSKATDLLTDALSALKQVDRSDPLKTARNMEKLGNALVKANTLANASVEQFSTALTTKAGAAAAAFGQSQEEVLSVLAAMADQGMKAELAGNAYDRILRLLAKSSQDAAEAHKKYGIEVFDANGKMNSMSVIMGQLEKATSGLSAETKALILKQLGFEARVQGVVLPLLGTSKAMKDYRTELEAAGNIMADVADKQLKSFGSQMKILKNQISAVLIEIGQKLAPILVQLTETLAAVGRAFQNLPDFVKDLILVFAGLAAAAGPAILAMGGFIALFGKIAASSAAMTAMSSMVIPALVAGVVILIAKWSGYFEALQKVNEEQERFNSLSAKSIEQAERISGQKTDKRLEGVEDPKKRLDILKERLAEEKKLLQESLKNRERLAKKFNKAAEENRIHDNFFWATTFGNVESSGTQNARQGLASAHDQVKSRLNTTKQLEEQIKAEEEIQKKRIEGSAKTAQIYGNELKFKFDSVMKGATDLLKKGTSESGDGLLSRIKKGVMEIGAAAKADGEKKMKEAGERIKQQFRTPDQILQARMKELRTLLGAGHIDIGTFERAAGQAQQDFDSATKKPPAQSNVAGILTASRGARGVAEAQQRTRKFLERSGPSEDKKQTDILGNIDKKLQKLVEKPDPLTGVIENAGLA